jgi:hypothetical protein
MLDEVAAVIVPSFLNAGFRPGILSSLALNGCSSHLTRGRAALARHRDRRHLPVEAAVLVGLLRALGRAIAN